jgi:hypothetical protein
MADALVLDEEPALVAFRTEWTERKKSPVGDGTQSQCVKGFQGLLSTEVV